MPLRKAIKQEISACAGMTLSCSALAENLNRSTSFSRKMTIIGTVGTKGTIGTIGQHGTKEIITLGKRTSFPRRREAYAIWGAIDLHRRCYMWITPCKRSAARGKETYTSGRTPKEFNRIVKAISVELLRSSVICTASSSPSCTSFARGYPHITPAV